MNRRDVLKGILTLPIIVDTLLKVKPIIEPVKVPVGLWSQIPESNHLPYIQLTEENFNRYFEDSLRDSNNYYSDLILQKPKDTRILDWIDKEFPKRNRGNI